MNEGALLPLETKKGRKLKLVQLFTQKRQTRLCGVVSFCD